MVLVYDYRTKKKVDISTVQRGVVRILKDSIEYGYFLSTGKDYIVKTDQGTFPILDKSFLDYTFFDGYCGYYILTPPFFKNKKEKSCFFVNLNLQNFTFFRNNTLIEKT